MRASIGLCLMLAASLNGCACADECDVGTARCLDDATMETCFLAGPDQLTAVTPSTIACLAPTGLCAELPGAQAACVLPERLPCDDLYDAHCDGTRVLFCAYGAEGSDGFVSATECADQPGSGRCGEAPDAPGSAVCL